MNILFFNNAEISPISNGIQRITDILSNALTMEYNYNCFSAFYDYNPLPMKTDFVQKFKIIRGNEYEQFKQIIVENKIDFIICQQVIANHNTFEKISNAAKEQNCKFIFCLHFSPKAKLVRPNIKSEIFAITHDKHAAKRIRKLIVALLPKCIYNYVVKKQIRNEFSAYIRFFDKVVLLSERYIQDFYKLSNISGDLRQKVFAIPNMLTYEENISKHDLSHKENTVLFVGRLSDRQKRFSISLKIWGKVQKKIDISHWKLLILGTGEDESYYKFLVKKYQIKNVYFEGLQEPAAYYKRASIYLMTSASEGFPLVLTEAQQMGVVPIAFDSFSSLHDTINNGFNGIIVENNNTGLFTNQLISLMINKPLRENMAENALLSCQQFAAVEVVKKWKALFESFS